MSQTVPPPEKCAWLSRDEFVQLVAKCWPDEQSIPRNFRGTPYTVNEYAELRWSTSSSKRMNNCSEQRLVVFYADSFIK